MKTGWKLLAIGLSIVAMLCMFPILVIGKERSHNVIEKNPTLKEVFTGLIHNKYLLVFYTGFFLIGVTNTVQIIIPIFAQYVLGDTSQGTVLLAMALLPAVILALFTPILCKKFDKFDLYMFCLCIFAVSSVIQYFIGYDNEIGLDISMAIRGVGLVGFNILAYLFTPDCVEYGQYKNGIRQEGVCFAVQTFITKIVNAAVNALSLAALAWFGFAAADADNVTGVVNAMEGHGCWAVMTWFSAIGTIIAIPFLIMLYKLREKDVNLMAQYNNGEISREMCEEQMKK